MIIDRLIEGIISKKSPIVVGLDPNIEYIPDIYKCPYADMNDGLEAIGNVIFDFNKDVIDCIYNYVPAVKPQIAYYELYGMPGLQAFYKTVKYAKEKGLVVIEDGKRNDISETATAYAKGHLGTVTDLNGLKIKPFDVDFLTVNPYLGSDGLTPFIEICKEHDKGIFVLVKTSNKSSGEFQDKICDGRPLYEFVADYVNQQADSYVGKYGYSPVGAVVGATYPQISQSLRSLMPKSFFLVPGFGAQGGNPQDVMECFNSDGLGAIINSSRGIIYSYSDKYDVNVSRDEYINSVRVSVLDMKETILDELKKKYKNELMY